jgi:hypothetical protein
MPPVTAWILQDSLGDFVMRTVKKTEKPLLSAAAPGSF